MTQLTDKVVSVEVPKDAYNFAIVDHKVRNLIDERDMKRIEWDSPKITHKFVIIPFGTYRFLFTTGTATEEDARKVVEKDNRGYKHYWEDKGHVPRGFNSRYKTALESLASLLRSKGLDDKNNYALIEKLK